eukprot:scaffold4901_cov77-Skeletonema_marinoi.AAC.1
MESNNSESMSPQYKQRGKNWDSLELLLLHISTLFIGYGLHNEYAIAKFVLSRTPNQIKNRLNNYRKTDLQAYNQHLMMFEYIKSTKQHDGKRWTIFEEFILEVSFILHGDNFHKIAALIGSKDASQVKRKYAKEKGSTFADLVSKHDKMRRLVNDIDCASDNDIIKAAKKAHPMTERPQLIESIIFEVIQRFAQKCGLSTSFQCPPLFPQLGIATVSTTPTHEGMTDLNLEEFDFNNVEFDWGSY